MVNWGNVTLLLCVVESPDRSDRFISVTKPSVIPNPNANDVGLMFMNLIGETFGSRVWEIRW